MLNEVLRLTQGDLSNILGRNNKEKQSEEERERNNEAFYKDYQGEAHE